MVNPSLMGVQLPAAFLPFFQPKDSRVEIVKVEVRQRTSRNFKFNPEGLP